MVGLFTIEVSKVLEQVAQRGGRGSGDIKGWNGLSSEQPDLAVGVPVHRGRVGPDNP